jgi:polysaccharide export outer membrane protein
MKRTGTRKGSTALALLAFAVTACAGTQREMPSAHHMESVAAAAAEEYTIGPHDVLQITIWRQPELSVPEAAVRLDGKISVPLLDDIEAAGHTPEQLKYQITERLEEYVTAPQVTVVVRQSKSKVVFILGEVAREGPVSLMHGMRVIDAISLAGGFHTFSDRERIKIIRNQPEGTPVEFIFDYDGFVAGKNLEQNILLHPGDRIIVPEQKPFWQR